ncbi:DUF3040 domain-containing protein [Saccharopolyspora sp. MS10]|uniref:DUF3040 domain-containing protein n=1 Tax=Saccharopolyspora sp. MS10 TaxID=3385973 RepID=UPI0039A06736
MHRSERRRLAEIENRLAVDDPEFARAFADAELPPPALGRRRLALAVVSGLFAGVALVLNDAAGFALCTALTGVLLTTRGWRIWSS